MRQLLPDLAQDLTDLDLATVYRAPEGPWLRATMVSSVDGAVAVDGSSLPLSGPGDRRVYGVLRTLADVVLVGAGTVRAEDYGPVLVRPGLADLRTGRPDRATVAVVTRSGTLDPTARLFDPAAPRPWVITCDAASSDHLAALRAVAHVVVAGDDDVDLPAAVRAVQEGIGPQVLSEGGPRLLGDLLARDLVDELDLTTTPLAAASDVGRIATSPDAAHTRLTLTSLLEDDGALFARWTKGRP